MGDPLRVALAGLRHGHIQLVIDEVRRRPGEVTLVALSEPDRAVRERYAAELGVAAYEDHRQLLERERPDAVGVAAVYQDRGQTIADCLRRGVHVIADKPICTTLSDLDAIEAARQDGGAVLHCLLEKRLRGEVRAAAGVLAAGELGELVSVSATAPHRLLRPHRPDWMFRRASYGGILADIGIHDIDLLLHLAGAGPGMVQALAGNTANGDRPEFEDHGVTMLRTDTGVHASLWVDWLSPEAAPYHGDHRMVLTGTAGTADLHFTAGTVTVATHREPPRRLDLPPHQPVAADFFDALPASGRSGAGPSITAEQVLAATRVAVTAQTHANDGRWHRW